MTATVETAAKSAVGTDAWRSLFESAGHSPEQPGILSGIRIVEAATLLACPLASSLLADFGAQVIKIEQPVDGDPLRTYPPLLEGKSLFHKVTNRNKLSISVNLRDVDGVAIVKDLVEQADVFITNFRLPTLQKWGLDYEGMAAVNPRLVMMHLTAYGRTGPLADMPGFARVAEAFAGLTNITGEPGQTPMFTGYPLGDALAGYFGAFSTMLALYQQKSTGQGELVDLGLYEPVLRMMEDLVVGYTATGKSKQRVGNAQTYACPSGLFPTADSKWLVLPSSTAQMWKRLAAVIDHPDLQGMDELQVRLENRLLIEQRVSEFTSQHDLTEVIDILREAGVACGPVNTAEDIVNDPHIRERDNLTSIADPELGTTLTMQGVVPKLRNSPGEVWTAGRQLGHDVEPVLRQLLQMKADDIAGLKNRGIV